MIITRSPLRVSLGGGGTDLPSYYREFGGFLVAAAIDKYVYITLHQTFVNDELILKYSKLETGGAIRRASRAPHYSRGDESRRRQRAGDLKNDLHGGHSRRHRSLIGQFHHRIA